jgi:hypothetical protein
MDSKYFVAVRPRTNDFHSVHKEGCPFLTEGDKNNFLGSFNSDCDAEEEGKKHFAKSKSCPYCSEKKETMIQALAPEKVLYSILHYQETEELSHYQSMICCVN